MRLLFLILLLANLIGFAYIRYAESRAGTDAQIALLQISPEKLKLLKPRGKDNAAAALPSSPPPPALACLEWGSFAAEDAPRAAAALARFDLADKLSRREVSDAGWWVYLAPLKTKVEADKKASEVKALGIGDLFVVQEKSQWRFALALGTFKSEEAANNHLAQLRQKGLRSAVVGPRGAISSIFVIRDPGDAVAAKIAGLTADFPNAQLKATACADALAAKSH
ncbi:MAG: SPOR domain-containing protein [Pseudomonadota bacterium]